MSTATNKTFQGLLGTKLGMTQVWDENGSVVPVTVIEVAPNVVTQIRNEEVDGYTALQIAAGHIDSRISDQATGRSLRKSRCNPAPSRHRTPYRRCCEL